MVYPGVIYFDNGLHEYFKIDLDSLPDKLSPIANFTTENSPGWTVIDECIYFIGGIKEVNETKHSTVSMNFTKYNTTNPNSTWEIISHNRNLRWYQPFVFAFGRKIYVISGYRLLSDYYDRKDNADWTYWGEYYNLDSQTWHYLPKLEGFETFSAFRTALMDKTTIVFYSVGGSVLLLYDVAKEEWIHKKHHHPNMYLANMVFHPNGLEQCHCRPALFSVANNTTAVVCHSTLYWLNNDLCLYGYDYVRKRWFQSNSLRAELGWSLSVQPEHIVYSPLMFYLDDKTFVAICRVARKELGIAIIEVDRKPLSLNVSLKFSGALPVDTECFGISLFDGMAIRKDQGSMLGKRKSASED
ncbi:hypothetical protein R3W88_026600 [Solanum pinnatisectum]|uniref:Uncharacterized protein n=1 Tax=Solanum pinnatisectum TaxID=50273 RepID=A0AAV9LDP9_9SOLN|nr:hypothetical protein R3W88_026600 [Solanum pinnatisectum]